MKPILFFDIETTANPDAISLLPEPSAPANYKDADKIALYVSEKKAEQITQAPLDADLGKVIAISLQSGIENQVEVHLTGDPETKTENDLIRWFWTAFAKADGRSWTTTSSGSTCPICSDARSTWGFKSPSCRGWPSFRPTPPQT